MVYPNVGDPEKAGLTMLLIVKLTFPLVNGRKLLALKSRLDPFLVQVGVQVAPAIFEES